MWCTNAQKTDIQWNWSLTSRWCRICLCSSQCTTVYTAQRLWLRQSQCHHPLLAVTQTNRLPSSHHTSHNIETRIVWATTSMAERELFNVSVLLSTTSYVQLMYYSHLFHYSLVLVAMSVNRTDTFREGHIKCDIIRLSMDLYHFCLQQAENVVNVWHLVNKHLY